MVRHVLARCPQLWLSMSIFMLLAACDRQVDADYPGESLLRIEGSATTQAGSCGAYGMLKIGLMTRVAMRHTGRPVKASAAMQAAFLMVFAASLLRLAYSVHDLGEWALAASALLWAAAFLAYLVLHGPMLVRQSMPRIF